MKFATTSTSIMIRLGVF